MVSTPWSTLWTRPTFLSTSGNGRRPRPRRNESRVRHHILGSFGGRELSSFTRVELQDFLDAKAESLSYSVVDHLKWDLRQILELGKAEGFLERNPAALLFTPRAAQRPTRKRLNWKEVQQLFNVLDLRERLIAMLAVLAGMRPGEILALQWKHVRGEAVSIRQRVYRGLVDTPKSRHSVRDVALPAQLQRRLGEWKTLATDSSPKAWVFSSEAGSPLKRDNIWRRNFRPRLQKVGLEWANFQVMRRTHSTLMRELGIDPKLVADQQGHTVDVNLNVYTKSSIDARKKAVERLENKLFPALTMPM